MKIKSIIIAFTLLLCTNISAQQNLTKEQILNMSISELSELPLEDLMQAVETLGVSSVDELFALIMNKNVSSASKTEEDSFTSPLSTTVITKDEMRTYGILSIEEAFRLIPGMIITEQTPGNYDIQMRGLNNIPDNNMLLYTENANTLLMIDGRPMHNYGIAALTLDLLPISIEDVERIEVVRGACGALYGANAVTGVINIITDKPKIDSPIIAGNMQMGNNNTHIGDIALRKAWNNGKIATGVTFNIQHRGRTTELLPTTPTNDARYYIIDENLIEQTRNMQLASADAMNTQIENWLTNGQIREAKGEEWLTTAEMERFRTQKNQFFFNTTEPVTKIDEQFDDLKTSRKNVGINGYLSIVPTADIRFDITGGYHQSTALVTDVVEDVYSYSTRTAKKGYANLNAQIKGLQINLGYNGGCQDYIMGFPGYKVFEQTINANAEYTFQLNDLAIKPGISYEWMKFENYQPFYNDPTHADNNVYNAYAWHYEKPGTEQTGDANRLYGFFDKETHLSSIAPSLRLDYKIGDLRIIGAFRTDKTRIPDKWNHSWQLAANYNINSNNFIRFVYGRSNRSCCLINTSAKYNWQRINMLPSKIIFEGNEDADLVHIDNFELGYRLRPSEKILIDAEAFYSKSEDFGALISSKSMFAISGNDLVMSLIKGSYVRDQYTTQQIAGGIIYPAMETRSYIKYNNLPFKVKQMGISLNMDYIISSKLIAKLNINWQQTKIDNYFRYNRNEAVATQLGAATQELYKTLIYGNMVDDFYNQIDEIMAEEPSLSATDAIIQFFTSEKYYERFAAYGSRNNIPRDGDIFYFGASACQMPETTNGQKHKATPNIYGMLGLIYKPLQQLTISAFANLTSKRTYVTSYSEKELGNRCTINMKVGYKPIPNAEVFFNAHNLFNNEKQEFAYCDKIGGTYTMGVNFEL